MFNLYICFIISGLVAILLYGKYKKFQGKKEIRNDLKEVENKQLRKNSKLKNKINKMTKEELDELC